MSTAQRKREVMCCPNGIRRMQRKIGKKQNNEKRTLNQPPPPDVSSRAHLPCPTPIGPVSPPLGDKTIAGSQYRPPTCMQTLPQIYLILACWCCSEHPPAPLDSPRASRAIFPPLPSGLRFVIRACKTTVTSHQSACPVLILRSTFITREGVQPSPPPLVHDR